MLLTASLAIKLEQHMGGANKPVFVRGVELDAVTVAKHLRASYERNIVKMDHIVPPGGENLSQALAVWSRATELVGGKR